MTDKCVRPLGRHFFVIITAEERASIDRIKFMEKIIDAD